MIKSFIPLRSGSKSIPLKNIKLLAGKPLAQWAIDASNNSKHIQKTIISTDSMQILSSLKNCDLFLRSKETATDTATSESALIEFCKKQEPHDIIVFIQATSPLITSKEIDEGIEKVLNKDCDSIVSVVRQKRFIWNEDGTPQYDLSKRPRRQEWNGFLVENGAFYISYVKDILESQCRVSGKIALIECPEETYYEIDEPSDWLVIESILNAKHKIVCK
jgi:CMP-N-acetylneuraminic acid synthetase